MFALRPERVDTVPVPKIVVLPDLAATGCPTHDSLLIEQHFNRREILL